MIHYDNTLMQNAAIFKAVKMDNFHMKSFDVFFIFALNIDYEYSLEPPQLSHFTEAVLTSTHNLCFRAKTRQVAQRATIPHLRTSKYFLNSSLVS